MDPILLLAAGALALPLIKKGTAASQLQFTPKNILWSKTDKKLYFYIDILNPSKTELKVNAVFLTVFANDKKIGTIERNTPITIGGNKHTELKMTVHLSPVGTTIFIVDAVINKGKKIEIKVLGNIQSMGLQIPVNESYDFSL